MSVLVSLECDRIDCDEEIGEEDTFPPSMTIGEFIAECGWQYDHVGLDRVLHCPEHAA